MSEGAPVSKESSLTSPYSGWDGCDSVYPHAESLSTKDVCRASLVLCVWAAKPPGCHLVDPEGDSELLPHPCPCLHEEPPVGGL